MFKTPFKALLVGSQIAAASLMATTAIAQTTVIETPQSTVIVPDDALEESPSGGFVAESDYPRLESLENYEAIADTLSDQGYSDIFIQREGPILTVTAQRAGVPTELVYSTANGRLVSVDGVETRAEPGTSSAGDDAGLMGADTPDGADDGEADDGASDDGGADDGTDGGADGNGADDGGSDDGADGGTDGGDSDGGADGGSDGGNSDSGADGGSDSGDSDGGADGGSDGGDSGGGSDGGSDGDSDGGSDSNG